MNNFYLLNEALNTSTIGLFEAGFENLAQVVSLKRKNRDRFLKSNSFWEYETRLGDLNSVCFKMRQEYQRQFYSLFETFSGINQTFTNENEIDHDYPNDCNAFTGFDFNETQITVQRQVFDQVTFVAFVNYCLQKIANASVADFWDNREELFSKLIFCEWVYEQIQHLNVYDDRWVQIHERLVNINQLVSKWDEGVFPYKNLGNISPETRTRFNNTLEARTLICPDGEYREFDWRLKWTVGGSLFRMYIYPDAQTGKVIIGHIGGHLGY